ncbi:DUF2254 domain-containing protein [Haloferula rosea]|uniref:DUF2254 domain-containing protein n=1 Tax=Haloferula rosea TaxID=490093 RepID=A0A934RGI0_9BACT|nr:DUF2254 domain-containing protein [Haloferula rosea]MBK1828744.1 DUF2254 domain-containing protein [Haloferula rosea]
MNSMFRQILRSLWEGLWFVPGLITMASLVVALVMTGLAGMEWYSPDTELVFDPAAAGGVMTALAAGSITVAAVVFSITMVVLSSASAQFGPRLLPNFMRKTGSKLAIGGFVGSFAYQIVVAAALATGRHVPDAAVWFGVIGGLAAFVILLAFIHMVSRFIQVPYIIQEVTSDLHEAFDSFCMSCPNSRVGETVASPVDLRKVGEIRSKAEGYVQLIDTDCLLEFAKSKDLLIRCEHRAGDFVYEGDVLVSLHATSDLSDELPTGAFALGSERTAQQDVEFAIRQLVEIAAKALSPGINDPYTAINVIERLGGAVSRIVSSHLHAGLWYDEHGRLRLVIPTPDSMGLLDAAYHPLRQHARGNESVMIALVESYLRLAGCDPHPDFAVALRHHAKLIAEDLEMVEMNPKDRSDFQERHQKILDLLERD